MRDVALEAKDKEQVHRLYDIALAHGGTCEGTPGPRGDTFMPASSAIPTATRSTPSSWVSGAAGNIVLGWEAEHTYRYYGADNEQFDNGSDRTSYASLWVIGVFDLAVLTLTRIVLRADNEIPGGSYPGPPCQVCSPPGPLVSRLIIGRATIEWSKTQRWPLSRSHIGWVCGKFVLGSVLRNAACAIMGAPVQPIHIGGTTNGRNDASSQQLMSAIGRSAISGIISNAFHYNFRHDLFCRSPMVHIVAARAHPGAPPAQSAKPQKPQYRPRMRAFVALSSARSLPAPSERDFSVKFGSFPSRRSASPNAAGFADCLTCAAALDLMKASNGGQRVSDGSTASEIYIGRAAAERPMVPASRSSQKREPQG